MKPKHALCLLAVLILGLSLLCPGAAESTNMRVINCKEWVSLWAKPSKDSVRLVKVPLGAVVTNCTRYNSTYTRCEYNGRSGYIKTAYLEEVTGDVQPSAPSSPSVPAAEEGSRELGTMKVVNCEEWVSLWKKPSTSSDRIVKVSLGSFVYNCTVYDDKFIRCEYNGVTGYILSAYLEKADATAPAATPEPGWADENVWVPGETLSAENDISYAASYSYVDLASSGEMILEEKIEAKGRVWFLYGIRIKNGRNEQLIAGCYDVNLQPVWCRSITSGSLSELQLLSMFTGGTKETPYLMIHNAEKGLQAIDIATGEVVWSLPTSTISLGASICWAVDPDGTMYIAGHNGPHPVAVSVRGGVMWAADPRTDVVYGAYRITLSDAGIICDYESSDTQGTRSHYVVLYSYYGETLDISLSFAP
ncbi:MAG: hypothetical protein CW338_00175 [Clostridiales bacterium]|nr:hypothetical protein [Clostridiales bacterium]